jgi:prepilin-type N-terminal cleavage/methylation domain-containing protein
MNIKKGFTLVEMLIAISIFAVIAISSIGILIVVTQVQVQSSSTAAVTQESQFLLQKLQYSIATASLVDIPTSTATSTLKLRMTSSSSDPMYITLASGTVYLQQGGGALQPLTSKKVSVSGLSFARRANPPGHDAVSVSYTVAYNTTNIAQAFSQLFQTTIVHVSAATFDSGVYPSVSLNGQLGGPGQMWSSVNSIIDFSGTNVGINTLSPYAQLSVQGGVQLLSTQTSTITCGTNTRGTLVFYSPGGSAKDSLVLCAATSTGVIGWQSIY